MDFHSKPCFSFELRGDSLHFFLLEPTCVPESFLLTDPAGLPFSADVLWQEGRASGAVYSGEEQLTELLVKVRAQCLKEGCGVCRFIWLHSCLLSFVI